MTPTDLPIGGTLLCRYVPHADVPAFEVEGWRNEGPLPNHIGEWRALMTKDETP